MKKIIALFCTLLLVSNIYAISYNSEMDSLELHRIDGLCSKILKPYKETDIYTKSSLYDNLTHKDIPNLTKCHLAYYSIDKDFVHGIYTLELWFQMEDDKLFLLNSRYYLSSNKIDFLDEYFIVGEYKKKYPRVRHWDLIQASKISIGMTKEECKLSLGTPKDVNRTVLENGVHEQWVYNYIYVYFKGNLITSFQD